MNIRNAFLLLQPLPTWGGPELVALNPSPEMVEVETYISGYGSDGHLRSSSHYRVTSAPAVSPAMVQPTVVLSKWPALPDQAQRVLVGLRDVTFSSLANRSADEIKVWREQLIRGVFRCGDERFFDRKFLSILYLEPEEVVYSGRLTRSEYANVIRKLRVALDQNDTVVVPQRFADLFVCHGYGSLPEEYDLVVVRIAPILQREHEKYRIAESIFPLADAVALIHRLWFKNEEILRHPHLIQSPATYVADLLKAAQNRNFLMGWIRDAKVSKAYNTHMASRLEGIRANDSARALASRYQTVTAQLAVNASTCDDAWVWQTEEITNNPYRRGVVDGLSSDLNRAGEVTKWVAEELSVRDQVISDFFRDYLNAAVARSNSSLQRTVLWLSVVAIVVAILPFLVK